MPELIPVPTFCPVTMAIRLACGHTLFVGLEPEDGMLVRVMMIKRRQISCLRCGVGARRRIIWVWDM